MPEKRWRIGASTTTKNARMGRSARTRRLCCSITSAQPARRREKAGKLQPPAIHSWVSEHRLGNISKRGDRYLRSLFTTGALAVIRYAKLHGTKYRPWVAALLARRPTKIAAIALANKLARMAWAMVATGERYNY